MAFEHTYLYTFVYIRSDAYKPRSCAHTHTEGSVLCSIFVLPSSINPGNLIGCLILVQLLHKSNLMHDAPLFKAFAKALAEKKVLHLTKEQVYVRGLLGESRGHDV